MPEVYLNSDMLQSQPSISSDTSSDSWRSGDSYQHISSSDWENFRSADEGIYECLATLRGHSGAVSSLAVSGALLYSGGAEGSDIRTWSLPELVEINKSVSGDGCVKSLLVMNEKVVSAHQDHKIRVWKRSERHGNLKLQTSLPTTKDYLRRCVPPNNYVQVRRHKKCLWIQHADAISVLAVNPKGDLLYSGSWDKTVKVWRASDFKCLESIAAHTDAVSALAIDREGFLFSGSADCKVKVWSKVGKAHCLVATLEGHRSSVNALTFNLDESLLYSGSGDSSIIVWERVDSAPHMNAVDKLRGHRQAVLCLASAGDTLCSGSADKSIRVWRRGTGSSHFPVARLQGHSGPVRSICLSVDPQAGVIIYSGSQDTFVKVWWMPPPEEYSSEGDSKRIVRSPNLLNWKF